MVVAVSLTDKEGVVPRHHTGVLVGMARGHIAPSSLSGGPGKFGQGVNVVIPPWGAARD